MYYTSITTDREYSDCLYFYHSYMKASNQWELFPYCVRHINKRINECFAGNTFTFGQLKKDRVNSISLLEWNVPVDIVDHYESTYHISNSSLDDEFFCNCTTGYFGPRCEYSFDSFVLTDFTDLVYKQFELHLSLTYAQVNITNVTCYHGTISRECDGLIMCLDWRQICDGVLDCVNGVDERECLPLESNECKDSINEYRCQDGRCIARSFLFDKAYDCMDKTDEDEDVDALDKCFREPSIACEEIWFSWSTEFQCGDGEIPRLKKCANNRDAIYYRNIFQYDESHANHMTLNCWIYLLCISSMYELFAYNCSFCRSLLGIDGIEPECEHIYWVNDSRNLFEKFCPVNVNIIFPSKPIVSWFINTLIIHNSDTVSLSESYWPLPDYVCISYDQCNVELFEYEIINNMTCVSMDNLGNRLEIPITYWKELISCMRLLSSSCSSQTTMEYSKKILKTERVLFHCSFSNKYISPYRTLDTYNDCLYEEDLHVNDTCAFNLTDVFQCYTEPTKCKTRWMAPQLGCDDRSEKLHPGVCEMQNDFACQFLRGIPLPSIYFVFGEFCNEDVKLVFEIGGETDETNCNEWIPTYSVQNHLCDNIWDTENGSDEVGCPDTIVHAVSTQCGLNEHYCAHLNKSKLDCLPIERAGDGQIDCLGASDERTSFCTSQPENGYKCLDSNRCISLEKLCNGEEDCPMNGDEDLCPWSVGFRRYNNDYNPFFCQNGLRLDSAVGRCNGILECPLGEDEWLCDLIRVRTIIPFGFNTRFVEYQRENMSRSERSSLSSSISYITVTETPPLISSPSVSSWYCHRGVQIRYINTTIRCLCPPSYYGTMCQYQSDRVSIFLRLTRLANLQRTTNANNAPTPSLLLIVAQLIVDQDIVQHEQIIDVSQYKYIFYLQFPPNTTRLERENAFIRIDVFRLTKTSVQPLATWEYNLPFPFLPVNRLSLDLLLIPNQICQDDTCGTHGFCQIYLNSNKTYCICYDGWIGSHCNITRIYCYPNAKQLQSTREKSICICPIGRFGPRCYATFNPCQMNTCSYHGQCYPTDLRTTKYTCLCDSGYFGLNCQFQEATLTIDFQLKDNIQVGIITFADLRPSQAGFLFIQNRKLLKNIDVNSQIMIKNQNQQAISRFVLLETFGMNENDYEIFIIVLNKYVSTGPLNTQAIESNHCPHVDSLLLNDTIIKLPPLAKVKYFARVCYPNLGTKCFYYEAHLCFCDIVSAPDCLIFTRESIVCDKLLANPCIHNGRCIQTVNHDTLDFGCVCQECTYGTLCQLNIEQYTLSFDTLFGKELRPGLPFSDQSGIVKICLGTVIGLVCIGLFFNILTFATFIQPSARNVGVGIYLLILSLINQSCLFILGAKFVFVLRTQTSDLYSTKHRLFHDSCAALEYLPRTKVHHRILSDLK